MNLEEIQHRAMELSETERARLAAELLTSIPATLTDTEDGVAEAWRRDQDLENDPSSGLTWEEIKRDLRH